MTTEAELQELRAQVALIADDVANLAVRCWEAMGTDAAGAVARRMASLAKTLRSP